MHEANGTPRGPFDVHGEPNEMDEITLMNGKFGSLIWRNKDTSLPSPRGWHVPHQVSVLGRHVHWSYSRVWQERVR